MNKKTSIEHFIQNNSSPIPTAPTNELETLLSQINTKVPWYKKINFSLHVLVPSMTFGLALILYINISQPVKPVVDNMGLANFFAESYDLFDNEDEYSFIN